MRTWSAFHPHGALCLFAHAFAATRRAHQQRPATNRRILAADPGDQVGEGEYRGNDLASTGLKPKTLAR